MKDRFRISRRRIKDRFRISRTHLRQVHRVSFDHESNLVKTPFLGNACDDDAAKIKGCCIT
jgi:hypothetical protein